MLQNEVCATFLALFVVLSSFNMVGMLFNNVQVQSRCFCYSELWEYNACFFDLMVFPLLTFKYTNIHFKTEQIMGGNFCS